MKAEDFGLIDLHMHSTVSDGTDTPEELLANVKAAGIGLFSLTDHDAVKGCRRIEELRADGDPVFIRGAEFSCQDEGGKYHILGYGYDPDAGPINRIVQIGHDHRIDKVQKRAAHLREKFGIILSEEEIRELESLDNPGKPHIAVLLVERGCASSVSGAIAEYLDGLQTPTDYIPPEEAIRAILDSGGIPVLAHPPFGSGTQLILGEEMDLRVRRLTEYGLMGLEGFYSGYTERIREEILGLAEKYSLYVTAGSDYHGTNKTVRLGDTGLPALSSAPEGLRRFLADALERTRGNAR